MWDCVCWLAGILSSGSARYHVALNSVDSSVSEQCSLVARRHLMNNCQYIRLSRTMASRRRLSRMTSISCSEGWQEGLQEGPTGCMQRGTSFSGCDVQIVALSSYKAEGNRVVSCCLFVLGRVSHGMLERCAGGDLLWFQGSQDGSTILVG